MFNSIIRNILSFIPLLSKSQPLVAVAVAVEREKVALEVGGCKKNKSENKEIQMKVMGNWLNGKFLWKRGNKRRHCWIKGIIWYTDKSNNNNKKAMR